MQTDHHQHQFRAVTQSNRTQLTCQCLPLGPGGLILTGPRLRLCDQRLKPPVKYTSL
jgi:hypothetical protein